MHLPVYRYGYDIPTLAKHFVNVYTYFENNLDMLQISFFFSESCAPNEVNTGTAPVAVPFYERIANVYEQLRVHIELSSTKSRGL